MTKEKSIHKELHVGLGDPCRLQRLSGVLLVGAQKKKKRHSLRRRISHFAAIEEAAAASSVNRSFLLRYVPDLLLTFMVNVKNSAFITCTKPGSNGSWSWNCHWRSTTSLSLNSNSLRFSCEFWPVWYRSELKLALRIINKLEECSPFRRLRVLAFRCWSCNERR